MHVLVTGASGRIGTRVVDHLLAHRHTLTLIDKEPLPSDLARLLPTSSSFHQVDLTHSKRLEALLDRVPKPDGAIHLSAIPAPVGRDACEVHNTNVTSSYNVMYTMLSRGCRRVVQASSINAAGGVFTAPGRLKFPQLPYREDISPLAPEDPYSLSKQIAELQASALCRLFPGTRIASLRINMSEDSYDTAAPHANPADLWGWVSYASVARAFLAALTEGDWTGHEVFNICAPEICHEAESSGVDRNLLEHASKEEATSSKLKHPSRVDHRPRVGGRTGSLTLLGEHWPGTEVDRQWWSSNPRRGFWDTSKAEKMLSWKHDD